MQVSSNSSWYTERSMWLVVALPTAAVVAGFITLWLALSRPDREVLVAPTEQSQPHNSVTPPAR